MTDIIDDLEEKNERLRAENRRVRAATIEECAQLVEDIGYSREDAVTAIRSLAKGGGMMDEIERLRVELAEAREEAADLQFTFDLQWEADMRAVKRWREAHPGNDLRMPDRCDMVIWLLEEFAKVSAADKWRDISTAPKDGTRIIVYRPKYDGSYIPKVGTDCWSRRLDSWGWANSRLDCPPSHWMPLPTPPETSS